ncbi:hypothetical protein AB0F18_37390 [Streptomyces sp. NPDC029216]
MQRLDCHPFAVRVVALIHHALATRTEAAIEIESSQLPWIAGK